jgi:hypothetical protein
MLGDMLLVLSDILGALIWFFDATMALFCAGAIREFTPTRGSRASAALAINGIAANKAAKIHFMEKTSLHYLGGIIPQNRDKIKPKRFWLFSPTPI